MFLFFQKMRFENKVAAVNSFTYTRGELALSEMGILVKRVDAWANLL